VQKIVRFIIAAGGRPPGDRPEWVFRPATMDGQPVALAVTIELVFTRR
jgi:hypothetical protein